MHSDHDRLTSLVKAAIESKRLHLALAQSSQCPVSASLEQARVAAEVAYKTAVEALVEYREINTAQPDPKPRSRFQDAPRSRLIAEEIEQLRGLSSKRSSAVKL